MGLDLVQLDFVVVTVNTHQYSNITFKKYMFLVTGMGSILLVIYSLGRDMQNIPQGIYSLDRVILNILYVMYIYYSFKIFEWKISANIE